MKFEPEVARDILLDVEELHQYPDPFTFSTSEKFNRAKKYDIDTIAYHCNLLKEAGFLNYDPIYGNNELQMVFINGITYDGHQFLDSIRSPKVWRETKTRAEKLGVFTINIISDIASSVISDMIKR
ncbi:DUF2513 domain-containing protein [Streptococcus mutans]|jgi:hypothetical protein|uniref:DUF2513 domain-containing protein n=1 Tax=Streptococcus mutans TaxID=1309 RepID=UPI0018986D60|nr:DUF2513 domain-containing protein [Streptococcus mutans]MCB4948779.1 DUF2513 domain-containing protein [Streptococcus mutans]MCB4959751.1 DUF2513 domain-containing protein [Streptococcus mutans]MCB5001237.1 DUF2513 domain-containing protein [Streptococcus mutans]MCB5077186.1 DUF2513 domain-containing protein [Streptococcus mutans]MCB5128217.1 DUF2513 domain-containing protein [Streptococcus mutans]